MAKTTIHLAKAADGSVAVSADAHSGAGPQRHIVPAESAAAVQQHVAALMEAFDSGFRPLADPVALAEIGRRLHEVFLAPVTGALTAAPTAADSRRLLLFISQDAECLNLPWELLPGPSGRFLVEDARWAIRRSTRPEMTAAASLPLAPPPLRILFTACAPLDLTNLDYEKEEEAILRIAQKLGSKVHLEIAEAGSFDELRELIVEHRPHIVHLSGHGSVREDGLGSFAFENERGRLDSRDAREIASKLFAGQGVRLVFVNGCKTAQAAVAGVCQALTAEGHVPLALGWGASIADDHATEFARIFFHEVAAGRSVDHAVAAARAELLSRGTQRYDGVDVLDASFALPQLHAADDTDVLFDAELPEKPPARPGVAYMLLGDNIRGLREGFVGRRRQLQRTSPALRTGEKNIVILTGIGGAGKSTLATRLANRCARDGFKVVALQARRDGAEQFCLRLLTELALTCQRLNRPADEAVLQDGNRPLEYRLRLAVEILNEAKILFVLDNLESLLPLPPAAPVWELPDVTAFFTALLSRLTGQGRAILTCRYLPQGFDPDQPNLAHEPMPDFTEADFIKYLRRHPRVAARMENGELTRDVIETFHRKLGATPRFVEQASAILGTLDADRLAEQLESLAVPDADTAGDDLWQLQQRYFGDLFLPQLYETLSPPLRLALSRFALVREALPPDGVAQVAGLEPEAVEDFVQRCVGLTLLQRFGETGDVGLFAVYPLQREFFTAPERMPESAQRDAHLTAAGFFRACYEKDREEDLGLSVVSTLFACLYHATEASDTMLRIWAIKKIAGPLMLQAEYQKVLSLVEPLLAEQRHPDLLGIVARCAFETSDWPRARKLAEEAQAVGEPGSESGTLHLLASIDLQEGHWSAAREEFSKALAIDQKAGDQLGVSASWHGLATIDLQEGHWVAAREKFGKALEIKQAYGDRQGASATWHGLASIDLLENRLGEAREKFGKALAIKQAIGDLSGEASTWHNLASIDVKIDDHTAAREKFEKALKMSQASGDRSSEAATYAQLGIIDRKEGDYVGARKRLGEALAVLLAIGDRPHEAAVWHNLALTDISEGDFDTAGKRFGKALDIRQAIGDREGEAATWHGLASIDLKEGRFGEARKKFAKALAIRKTIGDSVGEAETLDELAGTDLNEGHYAEAKENFNRALEIGHAVGDKKIQITVLLQVALVAFEEGRRDTGLRLMGLCFLIEQAMSSGSSKDTLRSQLAQIARALHLGEGQLRALLKKSAEAYQRDRGADLVRQAFEGL